jgi:hypothetical protein
MRIEVVQRPSVSSIDGIRLDCFEPGKQYEVGNSLGALFLAEGWAVPMPLDSPMPDVPFDDNDPYDARPLSRKDDPSNLKRESRPPYLNRDIAADSKGRKHRRR